MIELTRERNVPQSTGWCVRDATRTNRGGGKFWDMRALQAAWPLHGRTQVGAVEKVKRVPGI